MTLRALLLAAALAAPATAPAQNVAGPYLAARIAGFSNDYEAAAREYNRLLRGDDLPAAAIESAVVVFGALGRFDDASRAAERMIFAGQPSRFGNGVRAVAALGAEEWDEAETLLAEPEGVGGALLDGLLGAWILAARGDAAGAEASLAALAGTESYASFAHYHTALVRALEGDFAGADELLSGRAEGALTLSARGVEAHAQVLMELDRRDDALELLRQAEAAYGSPALDDLLARVEAGEPVAFDHLQSATDGMAEAFFTIAAILAGETSPTFTLINAQAAVTLRPDHVDALVLVADLLEEQEQHDLAAATLRRVPTGHPAYHAAEVARAEVLLSSGREEAALEVLRGLTRSRPDDAGVWTAFADTQRRLENFPQAADAYGRAIELGGEEAEAGDWFLFYARGIAHERMGRFDLAEPDFRQALELNPDHPAVLNYLGYSLVEERVKLDEALDMIERAVAARPDDGYITDSLGWVFYRLGRFEDAVEPMERAVELEPLDPLINDHLGDVYWQVEREREARFQWRRALSLEPTEEGAVERIRRKLAEGLDAVLEDEGGVGEQDTAAD